MIGKRIYRAPGLMELSLDVGTPGAPFRIYFTGGTSSGYGSAPATFATSDPVLQCLIEQTPEYQRGIIIQ